MNPQEPSSPQPSQPGGQQSQGDNQPQVVYMARPHEPLQPEMSPEARKRHEDSKKQFPLLNLSEGEYVISVVNRHPIGLIGIWGVAGALILALIAIFAVLAGGSFAADVGATTALPVAVMAIPVLLISFLVLIFAFIATIVYNANRFFLTNESVIQHIQTSLFSKREQTVSLANVEDASFTQDGILPHILGYGMIRLSTQGDETTYRFQYASSPQKTIAILNNAVEAFKNGRPVMAEDSRMS